jgi:hypothetical protein
MMPAWDEAAVMAACKRVRLSVDPRRRRIGIGARLGAGAGSSLEFHDHRAYVAGDDLRHLDWSVYGRTEQLMLRRHRQEVSPRVEVILDVTLSMAITPDKLTLATNVAALLATLAEADGARPVVWLAHTHFQRLSGDWRSALRARQPSGTAGLSALPVPAFGVGSVELTRRPQARHDSRIRQSSGRMGFTGSRTRTLEHQSKRIAKGLRG